MTITSDDTALARTTMTDETGRFAFAALPAGSYTLVGSFPGFRLVRASGLTVVAGGMIDLGDLTAQVAAQEQVLIVGGVRGSLARSLTRKRTSDNLVDGITADDVADFPDLNISESLQRVTGVSINRVLGEGQQVTVRGLAPEFTRVTINGQTVASGNPGREIDFDVFASELFTAVNLSKTPTASLTEGGLAATIDLRTARPFDFDIERPTVAFSGQFSQNQLRGKGDPRISGLASNTFLDGKLGLLGSVSYSSSSLRQDNAEGLRFLLTDIDVQGDGVNEFSNVEIPFIPRYVLELLDRERLGVTAALQLNPSPRFDLNLDVAYARFDETRTRYSIDGLLSGNRTMPVALPTVDPTGLVTRATYDNVSSRSENIQTPSEEDLLLINLDAAWYLNTDWILRAKAGYSDAAKDAPEFRSVWHSIDTFTFEWTDRIFPGISSANTDYADPLDFSANQSRFLFTGVTDRDYSAQGDLERFFAQSNFLRSLQFGARFSDGKKT